MATNEVTGQAGELQLPRRFIQLIERQGCDMDDELKRLRWRLFEAQLTNAKVRKGVLARTLEVPASEIKDLENMVKYLEKKLEGPNSPK